MFFAEEMRSPAEPRAFESFGFPDGAQARRLWSSCARTDEERAALEAAREAVVGEFGRSTDAPRALRAFSGVCDRLESSEKIAFFEQLRGDETRVRRVGQLLSWAQTRADVLTRESTEAGAAPTLHFAFWTLLGGLLVSSEEAAPNGALPVEEAAPKMRFERVNSREEARAACRDYCLVFPNRGAALRRWSERELLRIALHDFVLDAPSHQITREIALLAGACLDLAVEETKTRLRPQSDALAFCAVGVGKFGGLEMHYASDLDVVFVFESFAPAPNASATADKVGATASKVGATASKVGATASKVGVTATNASATNALGIRFAQELVAFLSHDESEGAGWRFDARLHRRGHSGPLAVTISQMRSYFDDPIQGFAAWERQALTKARFAAGDLAIGARAMTAIRVAAHPPGWNFDWDDELRARKERAESERAAQGLDARDVFDVQGGAGTLGDIEWAAGWMALKHGHETPSLQTPNTRAQLRAAREANLLAGVEFDAMRGAYDWFCRAQTRLHIACAAPSSGVKRESSDFETWARAVLPGQPADEAPIVFEETWRAHTQNVRLIFERVRDML